MDKMDRNAIALTLKAAMVLRGRRQDEVARAVGITRQNLNAFLNRRIDLMADVVARLVREVGISGALAALSAPVDEKPMNGAIPQP